MSVQHDGVLRVWSDLRLADRLLEVFGVDKLEDIEHLSIHFVVSDIDRQVVQETWHGAIRVDLGTRQFLLEVAHCVEAQDGMEVDTVLTDTKIIVHVTSVLDDDNVLLVSRNCEREGQLLLVISSLDLVVE